MNSTDCDETRVRHGHDHKQLRAPHLRLKKEINKDLVNMVTSILWKFKVGSLCQCECKAFLG